MSATADPELFREVFGRFATGVAVITSAGADGSGGMTANSLCSLSLDPLLALVCFENRARTLPIVREAGAFAVNLLASDQEELARVFASKLPEGEKLRNVPHRLEHGVPIIDGAPAATIRSRSAGWSRSASVGASRCCGTRGATTRFLTPSESGQPVVAARASRATITSAASTITPSSRWTIATTIVRCSSAASLPTAVADS